MNCHDTTRVNDLRTLDVIESDYPTRLFLEFVYICDLVVTLLNHLNVHAEKDDALRTDSSQTAGVICLPREKKAPWRFLSHNRKQVFYFRRALRERIPEMRIGLFSSKLVKSLKTEVQSCCLNLTITRTKKNWNLKNCHSDYFQIPCTMQLLVTKSHHNNNKIKTNWFLQIHTSN